MQGGEGISTQFEKPDPDLDLRLLVCPRGCRAAVFLLVLFAGLACSERPRAAGAAMKETLPPAIGRAHLTEVSPYKEVHLDIGAGLRLVMKKAPAGLYFNYQVSPEKKYVLKMRGRTIEGKSTLRIRMDGGELYYASAPEGEVERVVSDVAGLELLFYSDEPSIYEIEDISIIDCPECWIDRDLTEELHRKIAGLNTLLRTAPLAAAEEVLRFLAPQIDFALDHGLAEIGSRRIAIASPAEAYFEAFRENQSGVLCGSASVFMDRVYRLLGLRSTTVDFGLRGTSLTHVAVVVAESTGEGFEFYLFDPSFNASFKSADGKRFVPLAELVALHKKSLLSLVDFHEWPLSERDWLLSKNEDRSKYGCESILEEKKSFLVCRQPSFDFDYYLNFYSGEIVAEGLRPDRNFYVELLRSRVFSVGGFAEADITRKFMKQLDELKIPYGY